MKIYILTCINEESTLVSCKPYKDPDEAKIDMLNQCVAERGEFQKANRPGQYFKPNDMSASVGDEEYCYIWNITEAELEDEEGDDDE